MQDVGSDIHSDSLMKNEPRVVTGREYPPRTRPFLFERNLLECIVPSISLVSAIHSIMSHSTRTDRLQEYISEP